MTAVIPAPTRRVGMVSEDVRDYVTLAVDGIAVHYLYDCCDVRFSIGGAAMLPRRRSESPVAIGVPPARQVLGMNIACGGGVSVEDGLDIEDDATDADLTAVAVAIEHIYRDRRRPDERGALRSVYRYLTTHRGIDPARVIETAAAS
jgi:hypothetical protein